MAHAYYHAKSSARHFGGTPSDYLALHEWMDHTKAHLADARHRLVLHNSWGIFLGEQVLGKTLVRASDGRELPLRPILEKHVIEDLGFIPTLEQCFGKAEIEVQPWMYRHAQALSARKDISTMRPLTREQIETLAQEYTALAEWTTMRDFCTQVFGEGKAVKAEIEIDSEYNDEDGYDYSVSSLTAYDANGEELEFDLDLPFWQQFEDLALELKKSRELYTPLVRAELAGIDALLENTPYTDRAARYALSERTRQILRDLGDPKDEEDLQEMALDALKEWYPWREEEKAQAKAHGYIQWSELPASQDGETEFDLTTPPGISFPEVYAPA